MKRYMILSCIWAVIVFLSGCDGNTNLGTTGESKIIQEEKTFVAEKFLLPEYTDINAAYADGESLYYIAKQSPTVSGKTAMSCYQLKQGIAEPELLFDLMLTENQTVFSMTCDANGNYYLLGYQTAQTTGESPALHQGMLWQIDSKGKTMLTLSLTEIVKQGGDSVPSWHAVDREGRIFLSSQQDISVLDSTGQLLFEIRTDGQIVGMISRSGKVLVGYMDTGRTCFKEIDVPEKKLVSVYEMSGGPFHMLMAGNESLLFTDTDSVYQYEPESNQLFKKFDWLSHNYTGPVNGDFVLPYGDNGIAVVVRNLITSPVKAEVIVFRELKEGETVMPPIEKTVITLGYNDYSSSFSYNMAVIEFNKNNPEYKIEVKYYDEDLDRFYADIISGNGPDILYVTRVTGRDVLERLGKMGALDDLYPYIDADESLSRSDFFENILKAYETQDSLYIMPVWYRIRTIVAPTSLVGERVGWNLEEFFDFAQSFPDEHVMFDAGSKSTILRMLKYAYTGQLAHSKNENNDTGTPINRELLTKILAFANQYEDDENYQYGGAVTTRIREGQVKLLQTRIMEGQDYGALSRTFGEPLIFIGYPTPSGNGNLIQEVNAFAINAGSKHKNAVWQFFSQILSKEAMESKHDSLSLYSGFYIRKDTLAHHFESRREILQNSGKMGYWLYPDNQTDYVGETLYYPFDERWEADFEQIRQLILSVDTAYRPIEAVDAIIEEEAMYYFNGVKSLEEVVDVIENRVQTYVNESR